MINFFNSAFGLVTDVAKIVLAPVQVAVDLTRAVTKPVADLAQDTAKELNKTLGDKP